MAACSYCGVRRATNQDHVVPKSLARKLQSGFGRCPCKRHEVPAELLVTVGSCFECNHLKGTRKLVPPSWEDRIPALKEAIPGPWRVWRGDVSEPAFADVHV